MSLPQISIYELLTTGIILIICCISDIKRNEIMYTPCFIGVLLSLIFPQRNLMKSIGGALLGFLPLFITALLGNGGGGDAIVAATLGFIYPLTNAAYIFLLASSAYVLILSVIVLVIKDKKKQIPYIPFLMGSWLIITIFSISQTGGILF